MTHLDKPSRSVTRLTLNELGGAHGKDKHRRLVVSLCFGDIITIRPHGTRRSESIVASDLYVYLLKCKVNKGLMERLRERKAKKQAAREAQRSRRIIRGGLRDSS